MTPTFTFLSVSACLTSWHPNSRDTGSSDGPDGGNEECWYILGKPNASQQSGTFINLLLQKNSPIHPLLQQNPCPARGRSQAPKQGTRSFPRVLLYCRSFVLLVLDATLTKESANQAHTIGRVPSGLPLLLRWNATCLATPLFSVFSLNNGAFWGGEE